MKTVVRTEENFQSKLTPKLYFCLVLFLFAAYCLTQLAAASIPQQGFLFGGNKWHSKLHLEAKLHFWPYIQIQFSCFSSGVDWLAGWEWRSTGQSTMVLFCDCRCDVRSSRFSGRIADVSFSFASEMRGTLQRNLSIASKENWGLFTMFNLVSRGVPFFRDSNRSSFRFLHVERFNSVWSEGEWVSE